MLFIVIPNTLCLADTSCYFSTEGHRKREKHYHLLAHMYSPSIIKIALVVGSHLADTLRSAVIEAYKAKVSPGKIDKRLKDLMVYIQGNHFKGAMRQIISETEELAQAMNHEVQTHKKFWTDRYTRYSNIFRSASKVKVETVEILKGKNVAQIDKSAIIKLLPLPRLEDK